MFFFANLVFFSMCMLKIQKHFCHAVAVLRHGLGFFFPWLQHKYGDNWTASATT